ncbi:hypothetical protein [Falsiroseomonas tokyonensis]|uniref:Polyvalent protein metallopeptidase domain-containing protein n=1 Tax=Falsiroseomonas tokyonensis TaxID=430521 RepID=A0ABV7C0Q2_9PROT|nr:hypothetical protein [Falsiroseomonas tokyonensis]MBU8540239.1 hypothetical protein [Falsiroseomonas tokyonensis]
MADLSAAARAAAYVEGWLAAASRSAMTLSYGDQHPLYDAWVRGFVRGLQSDLMHRLRVVPRR